MPLNPNTQRGLDNAVKMLTSAPEFDRIRLFLIADASASKPEADEIIRFVTDEIRAHLVSHNKAVLAARVNR